MKKMQNQEIEETKLQQLFDDTLAALVDMAERHRDASESDDMSALDEIQDEINNDPLSVSVRDGWYYPGTESDGPEEFEILLSTGGPATRIVGTLNSYGEVENFHIEVQDWFQPWTSFARMTDEQGDLLKAWYLSQFYFGEC